MITYKVVRQGDVLHSLPLDSLKLGKNVVEDIHEIKKNLLTVNKKIDVIKYY
jgi:hypothetical protein